MSNTDMGIFPAPPINASMPISYAIRRMKELSITSIPVMDKKRREKRIGIMTLPNMLGPHSEKVRTMATWDMRMVKRESSGRVALDVMSEIGTTWVAVEDGNTYVGCVTLKQILNEYKKQLEMLD